MSWLTILQVTSEIAGIVTGVLVTSLLGYEFFDKRSLLHRIEEDEREIKSDMETRK